MIQFRPARNAQLNIFAGEPFRMIAFLLPVILISVLIPNQHTVVQPVYTLSDTITLADPSIIPYKDSFYLYGTSAGNQRGFEVYVSSNLQDWKVPSRAKNGLAFEKSNGFGDKGFWAPQVVEHNNAFYLAYTANEQLSIAKAAHPAGPFYQHSRAPLYNTGKQIDPFLFRDTDGSIFLYFVRLTEGNRIFVAKMKEDLSDIDSSTIQPLLSADLPWENTENVRWPVTEGPTVVKQDGHYYLFYSANDFRSIDYAVGYATSKHPLGPWTKTSHPPLVSRHKTGWNGSGHGDLFQTKGGQFWYVFHTHRSNGTVHPRKTALMKIKFPSRPQEPVTADEKSVQYLLK
jgi:beta-xylosidase